MSLSAAVSNLAPPSVARFVLALIATPILRKVFNHETAFRANGYDNGVLNILSLHQTQYLGSEILFTI